MTYQEHEGKPMIRFDEDRLFIEVVEYLAEHFGALPETGTVLRVMAEQLIHDVMHATIDVLVVKHGLGEWVNEPET